MRKDIHITDIPELSEEAKAFAVYFIWDRVPNMPYESLMFSKVYAPFGAGQIDYVMYCHANDTNKHQVFSLVSSRLTGELNQGMVCRMFEDFELTDRAFIQFKLRPISKEGVDDLIKNMPVMMVPMES